jgi:tetratricopeptide (TPR) repeat protein
MPRPVIYISAASQELLSTRHIVANSLAALGYKPKWQDIAPTETGNLKAVLRNCVDHSHAVLQIVGHSHGCSPAEPDEEFGSVSYTQYEALYAQKKGKPVWYIILDESHPTDCENNEPEELQQLQSAYRIKVESHHGLCQASATARTTQQIVLNLCKDFSELRSRSRKRAAALIALLLVTISGITWIILRQNKNDDSVASTHSANEVAAQETAPPDKIAPNEVTQEEVAPDEFVPGETLPEKVIPEGISMEGTGEKSDDVPSPLSPMEKVLFGLADAENRSRILGEKLTLGELRTRAHTLLETELSLAPGTLADTLPAYARDIYDSPDSSLAMKANAAYALNKFEEAEELLLHQESTDSAAMENSGEGAGDLIPKRIQSLEGAAQFATAQIQFSRSVKHYRAAAALCSVERDPLEWARIHQKLAYALTYTGQFSKVADNLLQVIPVYEKLLGAEHPETLSSSNNLANALNSLGRHTEAEERHRAVLATRERVLGAAQPATLNSRNNLAATLNFQRKHNEAEQQYRTVLAANESALGADHPDTLFTRNNLAKTLKAQGKHSEAEQQYRAVIAIRERILGAEHPETLSSRENLAKTLRSQEKYADAEQQSRAILAIRERVLGAEHHDVFLSCHNLALSLAKQGETGEALVFAQRALTGFTRNIGANTPYTNAARKLVTLLLHE